MAKSIEMTGQNVQEAIEKALDELKLRREDADVEVLEEGEPGGFLGFGRKPARVVVTAKPEADVHVEDTVPLSESPEVVGHPNDEALQKAPTPSEESAPVQNTSGQTETEGLSLDEIVVHIRNFLTDIQDNMKLDNTVNVSTDGKKLIVNIEGDDCGILIGRRGDTLRSLQYLTSLYANRLAGTRVELRMDIGHYRGKREHSVQDLATRTAQKALRTGNAYELNPMGSNDRRIVHETLSEMDGIVTYSEGEEPNRYVVIDLAEAMDAPQVEDSYDDDQDVYDDTDDESYDND